MAINWLGYKSIRPVESADSILILRLKNRRIFMLQICNGRGVCDAIYHRSRIKGKSLCPRPAKRRDPKTFL